MVQSCSTPNCTVRFKKGEKIKFHRFPRDEDRRKKWLIAIRRDKYKPSNHAAICGNHFLEEDYEYNVHGNIVLKKEAIPSKFDFSPRLRKTRKSRRKLLKRASLLEQNDCAISEACNKQSLENERTISFQLLPSNTTANIYESTSFSEDVILPQPNGLQSSDDIKQEQESFEFIDVKINTTDMECRNSVDNDGEPEYKVTCLEDVIIKEELDVESEVEDTECEMNTDVFLKQECDDICIVKDEMDIEQDIEKEKTSYNCSECDFKSDLNCSLQVHIDEHHPILELSTNEKYQNEKCEETSQISYENNEDKSMEDIQCEVCDKKFKNLRDVTKHKETHKKIKFECEHCYKMFNQRGDRDGHVKTTHGEITYECEHCYEMYDCKENFKKHLEEIHDEIKHECAYCSKFFHCQRNLIDHVKSVHDRVRLKCKTCLKIFNSKQTLEYHMRIIHDNVKYECEQCHEHFGHMNELVDHVKATHEKIKYDCEPCAIIFDCKKDLVNHLKTVHNKIRPECEYCHKIFSNKRSLKIHINSIHFKTKHKCKHCSAHYTHECALIEHVKAVHDNITFSCKYCRGVFSRKCMLRNHIKAFHRRAMTRDVVKGENSVKKD